MIDELRGEKRAVILLRPVCRVAHAAARRLLAKPCDEALGLLGRKAALIALSSMYKFRKIGQNHRALGAAIGKFAR
jgi:hypothetical protein